MFDLSLGTVDQFQYILKCGKQFIFFDLFAVFLQISELMKSINNKFSMSFILNSLFSYVQVVHNTHTLEQKIVEVLTFDNKLKCLCTIY